MSSSRAAASTWRRTGLQGVESLRGAAMEWPDILDMAGVWAAALGIEVLDAE